MPDNWKIGLSVPLFRKGDKMKCENYGGIMLLNVTYKILSSVILERLKVYSEEILGEYRCGFKTKKKNNGPIICSKTNT
jgi:hypothetical protein